MAVTTYTPSANKIVHWTGVDFNSRPSRFAPIHLVQYDQKLPIIAVNLYNDGQAYVLPSGVEANILVGKRDNTFVSNPALGCNTARNVLYFEATYQMLYYDGVLKPVVELKLSSDNIASSSAITLIVDRNPIQEDAKESSNEYKSAELAADRAAQAQAQAQASANAAKASQNAAKTSETNAAVSEGNARDYAITGVELKSTLMSSTSVQERLIDNTGDPILDSNGGEINGANVQLVNYSEFDNVQNQLSVVQNRNSALEERVAELESFIALFGGEATVRTLIDLGVIAPTA